MRSLTLATGIIASALANGQGPEVTAKAALLMDADTGDLLFEKSPNALRQPASTTKIMTALLALEKIPAGTMITAPPNIGKVGGSSMNLKPGETLTREDALFGLMLRSGNDMAHALAVHISGSEAAFAKLMNERAKEIGCKSTNFQNPHGLPNDKHLTTAYDLALIAREAMKNDFFRKIVGTQKWFVMRSHNQKDLLIENNNKLLWEDALLEGVKTGYTRAAGRCFVGSRNENNLRLVSVVLGSDSWMDDTRTLFNWGYEAVELRGRFAQKTEMGVVEVTGATKPTARVGLQNPATIYATRGSTWQVVYHAKTAPVAVNEKAGVLRYYDPYGNQVDLPLVFLDDVAKQPLMAALATDWRAWTGIALVGACFAVFRRRAPVRGNARRIPITR
jgi:D-alanyl-D-alanine carboxypeptidase (penicillin-binding protein 5/6)